jgi:hypothetical protein
MWFLQYFLGCVSFHRVSRMREKCIHFLFNSHFFVFNDFSSLPAFIFSTIFGTYFKTLNKNYFLLNSVPL